MRKKILIIEDEPAHIRLARDTLSGSGYEVQIASNGQAGLSQFNLIKPDAIILDLMLPGIDGYEVCSRLRDNKNNDHIPIVIMSAKSSIQDKQMAAKVGADSYLVKPIDPLEIVNHVAGLLVFAGAKRALTPMKI